MGRTTPSPSRTRPGRGGTNSSWMGLNDDDSDDDDSNDDSDDDDDDDDG